MATHLSLRTDAFDGPGVFDRHQKVLVPGPNWPNDPRDVQLSTITYPDPDAVRDVVQALKDLQAATTLSPAKTDDDVIYRTVVYREVSGNDTIFACNPDDPANPDTITLDAAATALTEWYQDEVLEGTRSAVNVVGPDLTVTDDNVNGWVTLTYTGAGGGGVVNEAFKTIIVSGQDNVVADAAEDTLEFISGANIAITTNATNDSITVAATGVTTTAFSTIAVSGQSNVVADSTADTLTLVAGAGITITTNAGADSVTISSATAYSAGDGLSLTGGEFDVLIDTAKGLEFGTNKIGVNEGPGIAFYDTTSSGGTVKSVGVEFDYDTHLGWDTDPGDPTDSSKLAIDWDGMTDWDNTTDQTLLHEIGSSAPNIPIWADLATETFTVLDPNGGHTITTTGTTLTLTLKCIRYTAKLIKTAEIADDQVINYTGTACP